jgi:hypothetical protein
VPDYGSQFPLLYRLYLLEASVEAWTALRSFELDSETKHLGTQIMFFH